MYDSPHDLNNYEEHAKTSKSPLSILVLYATESGNALDAAEQFAKEALRRQYEIRVYSTDSYPLSDLVNESLIFFFISTAGSGAEPRSMNALWHLLLRADLPEDLFDQLHFSVFGLGDTSYERFCWPAKRLNRRLISLGATEIFARGEGDDQHLLGIDGALEPWLSGVFNALSVLHPDLALAPASPPDFTRPRIELIRDTFPSAAENNIEDTGLSRYLATVKSNERITSSDWFQDVRHIEFSFEDKDNIGYEPGDIAVIYPVVPHEIVETILTCLGWSKEADEIFIFRSLNDALAVPSYIPRRTTLRELFSRFVDVTAVPRRSFFNLLRTFTRNDVETEKLNELCSIEGADDLHEYCYRVRRTIYEVMMEFRSAQIPKEYIFDLFPNLRPRQFSIASSLLQFPNELHLCVAIVQYKTKLRTPRRGVCTSYLASLKPDDALTIDIKKGFLTLPSNLSFPVVCVGPGTGVAPIRALIGQRSSLGIKGNTLYFGCRSSTKDQHYAQEWTQQVKAGNLTFRPAFSRESPSGARQYVQDVMSEDMSQIWDIIDRREGYLYICGSANKMPSAVRAVIEEAAKIYGNMSLEKAQEYVKLMERDGRLMEECWN